MPRHRIGHEQPSPVSTLGEIVSTPFLGTTLFWLLEWQWPLPFENPTMRAGALLVFAAGMAALKFVTATAELKTGRADAIMRGGHRTIVSTDYSNPFHSAVDRIYEWWRNIDHVAARAVVNSAADLGHRRRPTSLEDDQNFSALYQLTRAGVTGVKAFALGTVFL